MPLLCPHLSLFRIVGRAENLRSGLRVLVSRFFEASPVLDMSAGPRLKKLVLHSTWPGPRPLAWKKMLPVKVWAELVKRDVDMQRSRNVAIAMPRSEVYFFLSCMCEAILSQLAVGRFCRRGRHMRRFFHSLAYHPAIRKVCYHATVSVGPALVGAVVAFGRWCRETISSRWPQSCLTPSCSLQIQEFP